MVAMGGLPISAGQAEALPAAKRVSQQQDMAAGVAAPLITPPATSLAAMERLASLLSRSSCMANSISDILTSLQNGVVAVSNLWQAVQTVTASSSLISGVSSGALAIRLTQVST